MSTPYEIVSTPNAPSAVGPYRSVLPPLSISQPWFR